MKLNLVVQNDADLERVKEMRASIRSQCTAEARNPNQEEVMQLQAIHAAIQQYLGEGLSQSTGTKVGGQLDFDMDALKAKDAAAAAKAKLSDGRLVFVDTATGRLVHAINHDENFTSSDHSLDNPILSDLVAGRPNAALQQTNNFTTGGVFVPDLLSTQFIDLARNRSVCQAAGARSATFEGGSLSIARATGDPTAEWRGEGQKVDASKGDFERITILPKFLGCIVPFTQEMIEDAANSEQILRGMIAAAMALQLDLYALRGPAAGAGPTGVRNHSGVNLIDYSTLGSPTNPYMPISRAVRTILDQNYDGDPSSLAMIQCPKLAEAFDTKTDTTGQPLKPSPWCEKLKRLTSKQVPDNLGNGTQTEVYVGDFSQMVFFFRRGLMIEVLREGVILNSVTSEIEHSMVQEWKLVLRASFRVDVALMRPNWFTVIHKHPTAFA